MSTDGLRDNGRLGTDVSKPPGQEKTLDSKLLLVKVASSHGTESYSKVQFEVCQKVARLPTGHT